jgi:hypothetical protein
MAFVPPRADKASPSSVTTVMFGALGSSHHRIYVVLPMTGVRTRLYRFCRSVGKFATEEIEVLHKLRQWVSSRRRDRYLRRHTR